VKANFLDIHNCHALLPRFGNLPIIRRLDYALSEINYLSGPFMGSIDSLIRHNQKTMNTKKGSKRLCYSPMDIAQKSVLKNRDIHTVGITSPDSPYSLFHLLVQFENGIHWKVIIPLQFLLKGWGDANEGHQGYIHTISQNMDTISGLHDWKARREHDADEYLYVGITGRNWLQRFTEHLGEMDRGSKRRFHMAWRESLGLDNVLFISYLQEVNLSFDEAMNWEEQKVEKVAYDSQGLNMIPGGFKGLKYLHKHRIIDKERITLEERDVALGRYLRENPRKGIPNPFISELWKDHDFYLRVIESRPKTLSPEQVRKIRELSKAGMGASEIVDEVEAINVIQVKNVLAGRTYKRD
jgi:hypothetical protein